MASNLPSLNEIQAEIAAGYVGVQKHPTADLFIYNYTSRAQWEHHWNPTIEACRGLILDGVGNVVARPFPKFFNYDQVVDRIPPESFEVFDKLDGSLGILYWIDDEPFIATRGSFTSPQAIEATKMLRERFGVGMRRMNGWTLLFEIIYPENRIVVDYGELRSLTPQGFARAMVAANVPARPLMASEVA